MALLTRVAKNPKHFFLITVTAPAIYGLIIPVLIMDIFVWLYQAVCFPVYQIPKVKRKDYINFKRGKLKHLNWFQRLNCVYCDYANGVMAYAVEVAGRTEWYWCPIKHRDHAKRSHDHYQEFIDYDDGDDFAKKHKAKRQACRACESPCDS